MLADERDERHPPVISFGEVPAIDKGDAHRAQVTGCDVCAGNGEVRLLIFVSLPADRDRVEHTVFRPVVVRDLRGSRRGDYARQLLETVQNAAKIGGMHLDHFLVGAVRQAVPGVRAEQAAGVEAGLRPVELEKASHHQCGTGKQQ